jgi:hypothetical protein
MSGAIIPSAHVEIVEVGGSSPARKLQTDEHGKVGVMLPIGTYDVTAGFPAFKPEEYRVKLLADEVRIIGFTLTIMTHSGPMVSGGEIAEPTHESLPDQLALNTSATKFCSPCPGVAINTNLPEKPPSFSYIVSAMQDVVKVGSPVSIEITKKNVSDHEINNARIRGVLPYEMDIRDDQGNLRPEVEEFRQMKKSRDNPRGTFSVEFGTLKTGESKTDIVDVSRYYDFTHIGLYTIQVHERDPDSNAEVRSNTTTVIVTP